MIGRMFCFFLEFLGYFIFFNALWWEGHLVLLINRYEDITVCCTLGFGRVLLWPKNRIDALEKMLNQFSFR